MKHTPTLTGLARSCLVLLIAVLFTACGGCEGERELVSLQLTPASTTIAEGMTTQFEARAFYDDGTTRDVTELAQWASSSAAIATVDDEGLATGVDPGTAVITATYSNKSDESTLTVSTSPVVELAIDPADVNIPIGVTQTFTATATLANGTTVDATADVTWASNDEDILVFEGLNTARAVAVGSTTVTATLGDVMAVTTVDVLDATIVRLIVTPSPANTIMAIPVQFQAIGIFSNGQSEDVTVSATWASSDEDVATIDEAGLATPTGFGTTQITAQFEDVVSDFVPLEVRSTTIVGIHVLPTAAVLPQGSSQQFDAFAILDDDTQVEITNFAMWSSSAPNIVTVSDRGLATAVGASGGAIVTASFVGHSAEALVTVTDAVLQAIEIDPPTAPVMPVGATFQFHATGRFTDGSTRDLTDTVTWSSSSTAVATVSNASMSRGLVTAVSAGTTQLSARVGEIQSAPVLVEVQANEDLSFITLQPPAATMNKGAVLQFRAIGHYTDGSTFDLTTNAAWSAIELTSNDPITELVVVRGLVTAIDSTAALAGGRGRVRAERDGIVAYAPVTVLDTDVVALDVDCQAGTRLECIPDDIGFEVSCSAIATYSDNTTSDISAAVTWSSTAPAVALHTGIRDGVAIFNVVGAGTATLRAAYNGTMSAASGDPDAQIRGIDASLDSATVVPPDAQINVGRQLAYEARALFRSNVAGCGDGLDAYPVTVTELASWSSSHPTRVQVSNSAGMRGLATALSPGRAQIQAFFGGMVGAAQVDILDACIDHIVITPAKLVLPIDVLYPMAAVAVMSDDSVQALVPGEAGLQWSTGAVHPTSWMLDTGALGDGSHTIQLSANPGLGTCSELPEQAGATIDVDGAATLSGLSISPPAATIPTSGSQAFRALATFTGFAGAYNVTPYAVWEDTTQLTAHGPSADRSAHIFNAGTTEGSTTITAVRGNLTAIASLTVSGATVSAVEIVAIRVGVDPQNLLGETFPTNLVLRFEARVTMSNGTVLANPSAIVFESSDPTKLDFLPGSTMARTRAPSGATDPTVVARMGGVSSTRVAVKIASATLTDMAFSPDPVTMPVDTRRALMISGSWTGVDYAFDISDAVVCTSSNTALLQVATSTNGTTLFAGSTVTGATPARITCVANGTSDFVDVFIRDTCVTRVTLSPSTASIPQGASRDFVAFAHFSDSHVDAHVATQGVWTSSAPAVLEVREPVGDHARRFTAITPGFAAVSFQLESGLDGLRVCDGGDVSDQSVIGRANAVVTAAAIDGVRIAPAPIGAATARRVPRGESVQLRAFAHLTNGDQLDVTALPGTTWSAQDPARASVSSTGMLTAHAVGLTVIDVSLSGGQTASLPVDVQDCGFPSVAIASQQSGKLPVGVQRQFTASAFYEASNPGCDADQVERTFDGITSRVLWTSMAPAVLSIATGGANAGLATALSAGLARVRATYRGRHSPMLDVLVVGVQLQDLHILPASPIETFVGPGSAVALEVVAEYTDGTDTFVLQPPTVNWLIIDPSIISIDQNDVLTGLAVGNTTFRAQFGAIVSSPAIVEVSPACITDLSIVEPVGRTFPRGVPFDIAVACETSDGSALPCNAEFDVTSGAAVVDDYTGAFDQNGMLRIASDPSGAAATLRATVAGCTGPVRDTTTVSVGTATLRSIELSPTQLTIPRGTRGQFEASGTYLGGTGLGGYDLTPVAQYHSSNVAVATPDNDHMGHVTAANMDGTTYVTASYEGVTSNGALLTVSGAQLVALDVQAADNCTGSLSNGFDAAYPGGGFVLDLFAIATYADGTSSVVVDPVWSLVNPVISGTSLTSDGRLITGTTSGTQRVRVAKDSVVAFFDIAIVNQTIASIDVSGPGSVPDGVSTQFDAEVTLIGSTAACSNNTYAATRNVFWSSSAPARGSIVVSGANAGHFTAHDDSGFVELTATRGTATGGPVIVDLSDAIGVGVRCEPPAITAPVGTIGRLRAVVDYSDGSFLGQTLSQAQWNASIVSGDDVIVFGNDFDPGVFAATATGSAQVRPNLNGVPVTQGCFVTVN